MQRLRQFDVFPKFDRKFEADARQRTAIGGIFSLLSIAVILLLLIEELRYFASIIEHHEMYVDPVMGGDLAIQLNVTFHRVPCDLISMDAQDAFGVYADNVEPKTVKTRVDAVTDQAISKARSILNEGKVMTKAIDPDGAEKENCPSCYGAERLPGDCCHTCDEVRLAYERKGWQFNVDDISVEQCAEDRVRLASLAASSEGCNLYAAFSVSRAAGNIHFIPGRIYHGIGLRMQDVMSATISQLNLSHTIHTMEFGERFPGQKNPLEGVALIRGADALNPEAVSGRFSYFLKVVPTTYQRRSLLTGLQTVVESNQYSASHHFTSSEDPADSSNHPKNPAKGLSRLIPGVFISYDLSPIKVVVQREHPYPSFAHFLLQLCAVCGGVLTVAGILDALLFHGVRRWRKIREGKQI